MISSLTNSQSANPYTSNVRIRRDLAFAVVASRQCSVCYVELARAIDIHMII